MRRTRRGRFRRAGSSRAEALGFGIVLAAFSVVVLGLAANWLAAALLAFTIFFYVVIYTMWLKRRTAQNIVIGGAAGALPPVIGWAAMTGSVSLEPLLYFLIIFMWTPPHFWALALFTRDDYARAGIPMMPNVAGDESTRRQILVYALLLAPVGALPWLLGYAGPAYGVAALAAWRGVRPPRRRCSGAAATPTSNRAAKRLFGFSIFYLFALFARAAGRSRGRLDWSVADANGAPAAPHAGAGAGGGAGARWRSRSCSPSLVVLFYVMALVHGPEHRGPSAMSGDRG